MSRIPVKEIVFVWSESRVYQARYGDLEPNNPPRVAGWPEAKEFLARLAHFAPKVGYDKTAFRVAWQDGETYDGRYDLHHIDQRQENPTGEIDLADHVFGFLSFYSGLRRPEWMQEATYQTCIKGVLRLAPDYVRALEKYDLGWRNTTCDELLRATRPAPGPSATAPTDAGGSNTT